MTREKFPLPIIEAQLAQVARDVHRGGFAIVRGLDPRTFTSEENILVFMGIANYIGEKRGIQDKQGTVLGTDEILLPSLPLGRVG